MNHESALFCGSRRTQRTQAVDLWQVLPWRRSGSSYPGAAALTLERQLLLSPARSPAAARIAMRLALSAAASCFLAIASAEEGGAGPPVPAETHHFEALTKTDTKPGNDLRHAGAPACSHDHRRHGATPPHHHTTPARHSMAASRHAHSSAAQGSWHLKAQPSRRMAPVHIPIRLLH